MNEAIHRVRERLRYFQEGKRVVQNVTFFQDDVAALLASHDALRARLAEAERLLSNFLWYGDVRDKDMNDDAWKFLGFPPDPRLSGNGSGERNG
jgi:hypothetical protein